MKQIERFALGLAFIAAALLLPPIIIPWLMKSPPLQILKIDEAFRNAGRDSFGTDVTDDVARIIEIDRSYSGMESTIEYDGFVCAESEINIDARHFMCTKFAWNFYDLLPKRERWTLEVLCASKGVACRVKQVRASVSNL